MGQTLSEPVRDKHSTLEFNDRLIYAASAMQGWRISMEDAHTALLNVNSSEGNGFAFFGVYDGHGGQGVAKYSGQNLHTRIVKEPAFREGNIGSAIERGFLDTDEDLKNDPAFANDPSGCTAVIAVVTLDGNVYVGNAGDSRAVISQAGVAKPMSNDHKPINKEESARIAKAGGFVEFGRVNGNLALSRAIGDFEFKANQNLKAEEQIVTALPEIQDHKIDAETEFIVLACDGIWDCLSSQDAVAFIRREISRDNDLQIACENLMDHCLARDSELGGIGCDNMTVVVVGFLQNRSVQEWYDWIKDRVAKDIGPPLREESDTNSPPPNSANDDYTPSVDDDIDDDLDIATDSHMDAVLPKSDLDALDSQQHRVDSSDAVDPGRVNSTRPIIDTSLGVGTEGITDR